MSEDVLSIAQIGQTVSVRQGEMIFREGVPGRHMYVVLEGSVEIWLEQEGKRIPAARLGPGDFFGEMSLLEAMPRSGTAIAAKACTLFLLEEEAFHELMASDSRMAWRIMKALSSRVRHGNKALVQRVGKDLQEVSEHLQSSADGVVAGIEAIAVSAGEIERNERQLLEQIKSVQQLSERIESIMSFIRSVASQTHILGLNAGIEAARSGEHGRGFAVIAEEIRKLSALSKENAEQIAGLIEGISRKMEEIELASESSALRSQEQAAATQRMALSTRQMTELAERLTEIADSLKA